MFEQLQTGTSSHRPITLLCIRVFVNVYFLIKINARMRSETALCCRAGVKLRLWGNCSSVTDGFQIIF